MFEFAVRMFERSIGSHSSPSASPQCRCDVNYYSRIYRRASLQSTQAAFLRDAEKARTCLRACQLRTRAASEGAAGVPAPLGPGTVKEIPVFPLGIVAFPTADIPLNIFEARYRVLFNTLLAGLPGIEEDLVNDTKPWCGSRLFGMCYVNQEGQMATIGTTLYITSHERRPDGQILVINKGIEKFQVTEVIEEKPVLICRVEMLDDRDVSTPEATAAGQETVQLFKDLIELNVRMDRIPSGKSDTDPRIDSMSPREVSYWIGLIFAQSPMLQQALLAEPDLLKRLKQEKDILEDTIKFLRAKVALQSAFSPGPSSDSTPERSDGESKESSSGQSSEQKPPPPPSGPD